MEKNYSSCIFLFSVLALISCQSSHCAIIPDKAQEENSLTFKSSRFVTPEKISVETSEKSFVEENPTYRGSNATILLQGTDFSGKEEFNRIVSTSGFTNSVFYAYKNHHNLIIRPDDIWTAIMVQFSYFVNANSEKLRTHFVNFEGKKELFVNYTGIGGVHEVPFNHFINEMVSLVDENIQPNIASWVLPNFTTTTNEDIVTSGAVLMATVKNYFNFNLGIILCGIPEITLQGTAQDWKDIQRRVEKLPNYELDGQDFLHKWSLLLSNVLTNFIKVKEGGEVDYTFWENIAKHHADIEGCASSIYLSGWLTVFSAFNSEGKWQVDFDHEHKYVGSKDGCGEDGSYEMGKNFSSSPWPTLPLDDLTSGLVQVPIKIKDDFATDLSNGEYKGVIFAGHLGHGIKKDGETMQPLSGWVVAVDGEAPKYLKNIRRLNA